MKIVIATAVYYPMVNGVAVFSHNLALGLARRGHDVAVICPSQTGKSYSEMVDGVKVYYLRSVEAKVYPDQIHEVPKRKKFLGKELPNILYKYGFRVSVFPGHEVKRILQEVQPDVVHVQVSDPIGLSVVSYARKVGIPVVTTEHNQPEVITEPLKMPGFIKKPVDALLAAYFANRQSKSDFVTMPTEKAIIKLLDGRGLSVPIAAVSNGVDLAHFKPGKVDEEFYKEIGLDSRKKTVLYVGRVDPEKKVGMVVEAFLKARIPDTQLVVVGDGVDLMRLKKKYKDAGDVRFLGKIMPPKLYKIYQVGDVFVTASEIETQGIVLIEAAASELPLVAVDAGAVGEICVDGVNGRLCRPGDVNGIAEALKEILSDEKLRLKYGAESVKLAKEHDFERTLSRFENIYKKVQEKRTS